MKRIAMIAAALCIFAAQGSAQYLDYKMHQGDLLVYEEAGTRRTTVVRLSEANYQNKRIAGEPVDSANVYVYTYPQITRYFECYLGGCVTEVAFMSIDSNGLVYQKGNGELGYKEMFPTYIPTEDTLYLHYDSHNFSLKEQTYNYRAFDTVIYGATVRALSFIHVHGDSITYVVVADRFGYVRMNNQYEDWRLSSAEIAGVKYNRDMRKFSAFPTCSGSEFVYEVNVTVSPSGKKRWYNSYKLEDTLIGGSWYFKAIDPGDLLWHSTANAPYRVQDGIFYTYSDTGETMHDSTASIGTSLNGTVIDTSAREVFGMQRRTLRHYKQGSFASMRRLWAEGIGLIEREEHDIAYHAVTRLVYAKICGTEYGTPVDVEPLLPTASSQIISVYPNPVSISHSQVWITAMQPLQEGTHIAVYDMLGRNVYTESTAYLQAAKSIALPLLGLNPGMYVCTVTGTDFHSSKIFAVTP
jgi:Secretion system C-terminal sorting domain